MSYDVHAYPPDSPNPSRSQAQAFFEAQEKEVLRVLDMPKDFIQESWTVEEIERREALVSALTALNPKLSRANPDFVKMAQRRKITEEQARASNQHAILNPAADDLAIQLRLWRNSASILVPYWYRGGDVQRALRWVLNYLKVIRNVAGYFAYDPQTEIAFDPASAESYPTGRYALALNTFQSAVRRHEQKPDLKQ